MNATAPDAPPALFVDDLVVEFDDETGAPARAVDGVSFSLPRGEVVALVGESGCGKSATAAALLDLLPRNGRWSATSMRLGDLELTSLPARAWRGVRGARLGLVLQEPGAALHPVRRVGDQLVETLRARRDLPPTRARQEAVRWLRRVGIPAPEERARAWPHELSGGMKQRVALALALCLDPDVLVADEPTTALDVTVQAQFLALLRARVADGRRSVLLITHDLGVVAEAADRVWVMYAGRIVEAGPAASVFASPRHPYTSALLACRPGGWGDDGSRGPLPTIPGRVPGVRDRPPGCAFHPRCRRATDACAATAPALAGDAHRVACIHPDGDPR